ncbi:MAG: DIP1984 family protein [Planctomycetes bacterium]|nr:DIP1984 family protein [Planctomycetota bacterium]
MKLAEALLLRADLQKKLVSLRTRIAHNAVVQQGDKPHEDPNKLLLEAAGVLDQLEKLLFQINSANLGHKLKDGRPLTQALAHRDALALRHGLLEAAIGGAQKPPERYGLKEIKWVAKVNVEKLQKQSDDLSKQLRVLNGAIQEANWKIEI